MPQHNLNVCLKHFEKYVNDQTIKTLNKYHWYDFRKDAKLTKMLEEAQRLKNSDNSSGAATTNSFPESKPKKERWAIAISGGRDSMALANVLSQILKDKVDLFGVHVDFGALIKDESKTETTSDVYLFTDIVFNHSNLYTFPSPPFSPLRSLPFLLF